MTSRLLRRSGSVVAIAMSAALLVSCGDPAESGVSVIEGKLADQIGLGSLDAACDQPDERSVGTEFACSATTDGGEKITFDAIFEEKDRINVAATNLLLASELPTVEKEAAELLGPKVNVTIDPSDIDCGDESVVLDENDQFACVITESATGKDYTLTATFTDWVRDKGFQGRDYKIGDAIG